MLVRMKARIGGYRDGEPWPAPGDTIDVPAHEAHSLIANGYAALEPGERLIEALTEPELVDEGQAVDDTAPEDEPDDEEREDDGTDWTFGDPAGDGDAEAAEDSDEDPAEHGDEETVTDEVAAAPAEISPTVPTGARKPKRR